MKKAVLISFFGLLIFSAFISRVKADDLLDVQKGIDKNKSDYSQTQADLSQIRKDITYLSNTIYGTQAQLAAANKKVASVRKSLERIEKDLSQKKETLAFLTKIRDEQIRALYMNPPDAGLELFLASADFQNFTALSVYQEKVVGESEDLIKDVNKEIALAEETRAQIALDKKDLETAAARIASQLAATTSQYYYVNNQQNALQGKLAQINSNLKNLTEKQKELIAKKLAAAKENQTIGDQAPPSTPLPNAGFSPAYAFASYGYPHRVGMNQYGAYGRAAAGQSYLAILKAYYSGVSVGKYSVPSKINVAGYGSISFEDKYLLGISEMPRSWSSGALKAQAVAARTYALNWLNNNPGSAICTTQACQVYNASNANCSGTYNARWCSAVKATKGVVITYGGSPITAWYASTAGGYTLSAQEVWGSNVPYAIGIKDYSGSWPKGAYDKSSPWFHKAWGNSRCGGSYFPWLAKAQVTDIFNAALLSQVSSSYNQHLSPTDGCLGPAGWGSSKVISELNTRGVKDVGNLDDSGIFIGYDNRGHTSSVTFVSSKYPSGKTFGASFFSSIYHVRSPGTLSLTTNLFDVVIK